jgi:hypothetical protein
MNVYFQAMGIGLLCSLAVFSYRAAVDRGQSNTYKVEIPAMRAMSFIVPSASCAAHWSVPQPLLQPVTGSMLRFMY